MLLAAPDDTRETAEEIKRVHVFLTNLVCLGSIVYVYIYVYAVGLDGSHSQTIQRARGDNWGR